MKVAILLVGYIRTWDSCKEDFWSMFGHLNPDVFLSTYKKQYGHHPHIQGRIGDYSDAEFTEQQVQEMFQYDKFQVDLRPQVDPDYFKGAVDPMFHDAEASFGQQLNWYNALRMATTAERTKGPYDVIIKTRCDLLYNQANYIIPDILDKNTIVDSGNVFPNDCIVISNRQAMIDTVNHMTEEFFRPTDITSAHMIPHKLLENSIRAAGQEIVTAPLIRGVVRKTGEIHHY